MKTIIPSLVSVDLAYFYRVIYLCCGGKNIPRPPDDCDNIIVNDNQEFIVFAADMKEARAEKTEQDSKK